MTTEVQEAQVTTENPRDKLERVLRAYYGVQEQRSALKRQFEAEDATLVERVNKIRATLLQYLDKHGTSRIDVGEFKAHVRTDRKARAADWELITNYILENDRLDLLERRLSSKAVLEIADQTGELPPGVSVVSERTVVIGKK